MSTLILKKQCKGYYSNKVDNIKIVVSEFEGNWTGVITNEKAINDEEFLIYKCFSKTKKDVINYLINKIKTI
jgi:hypothetical protein